MEITQTVNPFSSPGATSNSSVWTFLIVLGVIGAVGFYFYRKNQLQLRSVGL